MDGPPGDPPAVLGIWTPGGSRSRPSMQPQESRDKAETRPEGKHAASGHGSLQLPGLVSQEGLSRP